jgi:hypothetical protein
MLTTQGTRVYVYRWLNAEHHRFSASAEELQSLPALETERKWTKKAYPGT